MKNFAALSVAVIITASACPALARDPYIVDDAGIAEKGTLQNTYWLSHSNEAENVANMALAYQAFANLETTVQATRDIGAGNNDTQFTLQEKYQWHNGLSWLGSLTCGVTYDTVQQQFSGAYAYIPVTFNITPVFNLSFDGGWEYSHPTSQASASWRECCMAGDQNDLIHGRMNSAERQAAPASKRVSAGSPQARPFSWVTLFTGMTLTAPIANG